MRVDELIGLRDADLTDAERTARDALLRADPEAAAAHAAALGLTDTLSTLPVLESMPRPGRARWLAAPALAAAAALIVAVLPSTDSRDKGVTGSAPLTVQLQAAVDGPTLRALTSGASVGPGEWVAFRIQASSPGDLTLTEHVGGTSRRVYPATGGWSVSAGVHFPGGDAPLSWRPDGEPGSRTYIARLCPAGGATGECAEDTLTLHWDRP